MKLLLVFRRKIQEGWAREDYYLIRATVRDCVCVRVRRCACMHVLGVVCVYACAGVRACLYQGLCVCVCARAGVHACVCTCSVVSDSVTPWTAAHQAPLSMGFSIRTLEGGCHFLLQGILPTQRSNRRLLCLLQLAGEFFTTEPPGRPLIDLAMMR